MGLEVPLPEVLVTGDLQSFPCLVQIQIPFGDLKPLASSYGANAARWTVVAPGLYALIGGVVCRDPSAISQL